MPQVSGHNDGMSPGCADPVLNLFPSMLDCGLPEERCQCFREKLATAVSSYRHAPVYLVQTRELLEPRNFSVDLMHPTSVGYFQIADRLLRELISLGIAEKVAEL